MGNVLGTVPALPTSLSQDAVDALRERTPFDEREVRPISEMMGSGGLQTPHRAAGGSLYAMITYTAAATLPPTWVCWGHWRRLTSEAVCSGSAHG